MKALFLILSFNAAFAADVASFKSQPQLSETQQVAPYPYEEFLQETSKATKSQIIFRSNDRFSGDSAYNKLFANLVAQAQSNSPLENIENYEANLSKLRHIWENCLSPLGKQAEEFLAKIENLGDDIQQKLIALEGLKETFLKVKIYLKEWYSTIHQLYYDQLSKAGPQAKAASQGFSKAKYYQQAKITAITSQLEDCVSDINLLIEKSRYKKTRESTTHTKNSASPVPPLNLGNSLKGDEDTSSSPRRLTPRELLRTLSPRNLIIRTRSSSEKAESSSMCRQINCLKSPRTPKNN